MGSDQVHGTRPKVINSYSLLLFLWKMTLINKPPKLRTIKRWSREKEILLWSTCWGEPVKIVWFIAEGWKWKNIFLWFPTKQFDFAESWHVSSSCAVAVQLSRYASPQHDRGGVGNQLTSSFPVRTKLSVLITKKNWIMKDATRSRERIAWSVTGRDRLAFLSP